jgi:hypothetical protein
VHHRYQWHRWQFATGSTTLLVNLPPVENGNNIRLLTLLSELEGKNLSLCKLYQPKVSKQNNQNFSDWRFFPFAIGVKGDTGGDYCKTNTKTKNFISGIRQRYNHNSIRSITKMINIQNGRVTLLIPAGLYLSQGMFSNKGLRAQGRRFSQQRWALAGMGGWAWPWAANISGNFRKIWNIPHGILRGLGETDLWKKPEVKNLVALPL